MIQSFYTGLAEESNWSVVHVETYQEMVGSLMYLLLRTRLDILGPVSILTHQ